MSPTDEGQRVGPGLKAALRLLGDPGRRIEQLWSAADPNPALDIEASAADAALPDSGCFAETRLATRWRTYGRCGLACALLRRAGSESRQADRPATQDGDRTLPRR